jgi:dihydroxyacetone kinase-like predicted kinase
MKISYLDGIRFYRGLLAGGKAVIQNRAELDRINVFPVADADTGINLTLTMQSILEQARLGASLRDTFRSVADAALVGARGNSGIIFAQYLYGLSRELPEKGVLNPRSFSEGAQRAVKHLYDSLLNPVEGTMLTVIREWSDFLVEQSAKTQDFMHLLTASWKRPDAPLWIHPAGSRSWPMPESWMPAPADLCISCREWWISSTKARSGK